MPQNPQHRVLIKTFWENDDYRDFLQAVCTLKLAPDLATKVKFARLLKVSPPFITKVFAKKGHLSLEQAQSVTSTLGFGEQESLAFLDKLLLAKSSSKDLRTLLTKRIKSAFDLYYHPVEIKKGAKTPPPGNLLFFKIAAVLIAQKNISLSELARTLGMQPQRVQFLLEKMSDFFDIQTCESESGKTFHIDPSSYAYSPRAPGSQSLYELGMSLRRLATYSLESRYPIHLVDEREHYVSGSYIIPCSEKEIAELSVLFAELTKKITNIGHGLKPNANSKFIGICFDMFDTVL